MQNFVQFATKLLIMVVAGAQNYQCNLVFEEHSFDAFYSSHSEEVITHEALNQASGVRILLFVLSYSIRL